MGCTDTAKHIGCVAGGVFDLRVKFFTDLSIGAICQGPSEQPASPVGGFWGIRTCIK